MNSSSPENYYCNPEVTGHSFEERTGDADPFSAGIGRLVLNFSALEEQLSAGITKCLALEPEKGKIVTVELAFKAKVHILSSLVKYMLPTTTFNVGDDDPLSCWSEISRQCFRAEALRNQVLHSQWSGPYLSDFKANRMKITAKASKGLRERVEVVDSARLLDIADYIVSVATFVEEFFFVLDRRS